MPRYTINLPEEVYERIRVQAFKLKVPMSYLIIQALTNVPSTGDPKSTGPISKGGPTAVHSKGDVSLETEFHPVPKGKK
jgi:hypothetical protein